MEAVRASEGKPAGICRRAFRFGGTGELGGTAPVSPVDFWYRPPKN